jgi:hypothetical protein
MKQTNLTPEQAEAVRRVLAFDTTALGKSRKTCAKPIEIQKPNVELFDDPQHNGQYWGN